MAVRWWRSAKIWKTGMILLGGLAIGFASFWLTSATTLPTFLGPSCRQETLRYPGFDPWTGEPYGDIFLCANSLGIAGVEDHIVTAPVPDVLKGRRAMPIPLGTLLGIVGLSLAFVVADGRSTARTARIRLAAQTAEHPVYI